MAPSESGRTAYGVPADADPLAFLLSLNLALALAAKEAAGEAVTPPGLPAWIVDRDACVTDDGIRSPLAGARTSVRIRTPDLGPAIFNPHG